MEEPLLLADGRPGWWPVAALTSASEAALMRDLSGLVKSSASVLSDLAANFYYGHKISILFVVHSLSRGGERDRFGSLVDYCLYTI